jgi:hypothetical protein
MDKRRSPNRKSQSGRLTIRQNEKRQPEDRLLIRVILCSFVANRLLTIYLPAPFQDISNPFSSDPERLREDRPPNPEDNLRQKVYPERFRVLNIPFRVFPRTDNLFP